MSTILVTRAQFEYSIVKEFSDYSLNIANALLLTEVREQTLRDFKTANICQKAIRDYFKRYDGETPPSDDDNGLLKAEIEDIVKLFNMLMNSNYWYEFPNAS